MSNSKVDFITNLLSEKRLNTVDKERLLKLASEELKNLEATDEGLLKRIEDLEQKINGKDRSDYNYKDKKSNNLPHSPKSTVEFLRKFKYEDGSGFKELIHDTDFELMPYSEILRKITTHPNFISSEHDQKVEGFKPIHGRLQQEVKKLIESFQNKGAKFIETTGQHPFEKQKEYTKQAKTFKTNYRFGSGREYTHLAEMLLSITKKAKYKNTFKPGNIKFLPDRRKFDIRANFFTWVPSIRNGIYYFFDGIKDHGNIKGNSFDPEEKIIKIECWKQPEDNCLFVSFLDEGTIAKHSPEHVFSSFRESNAYKIYFWSLCDWFVEADFKEDNPYQLGILESRNREREEKNILPLNQPVGGFKHILMFYDL